MKALALAALLLSSQLALAENVVPVQVIPTTPVTVQTVGVGCRDMEGLKVFYFVALKSEGMAADMLGSQTCFRADPGDVFQVIDGSLNDSTVTFILRDGTTRVIPTFVFGDHKFL